MTTLEFVFIFNTQDLPEKHFGDLEPSVKILFKKNIKAKF